MMCWITQFCLFGFILFSLTAEGDATASVPAAFVSVDYVWPYEGAREEAIADGTYIQNNNVITGIKAWKDETFITVSRWLPGVPFTLNRLTFNNSGHPLLEPYPSAGLQEIDNCTAFQFVQSMEVDPATGLMWIIDVGRRDIWLDDSINNCPPKLVIYDMNDHKVIQTHTFPDTVFSYTGNFVNDIVVSPDGLWAYMSDVGEGPTGHRGGVVVYNVNENRSHRLEHSSMNPEPDAINITIGDDVFEFEAPSDGIALSPDGKHLFYCSLGGYNLYHLETAIAQDTTKDLNQYVRNLGPKVSQTDGMLMGHRALYFGALSLNAVYKWDYIKDMDDQNTDDLGKTDMKTQTLVMKDDTRLIWPDTFSIDDEGNLLTTANSLPYFRDGRLDWTGASGPNFRVVSIPVADASYIGAPFNSASLHTSQMLILLVAAFIHLLSK